MSYKVTICVSLAFIILFYCFSNSALAQEVVSIARRDGNMTPIALYGDWHNQNCPPTVILSHGLGGNEEGLKYLGETLAPLGYRIAVMGHKESGRRALFRTVISRDKTEVITDPEKYHARFMDLEAAIEFSVQYCRPSLLVMGGHSMGAATVMLEAGAKGKVPVTGADRFDAYIAISPQGIGWMFDEGAWSNIRKPVLMLTGTEDSGFDGDYKIRLAAFEGLPPGNKRLAIIDGATHFNLGGRRNKDVQHQAASVVVEFLNQIKNGKLNSSRLSNITITDK